MAPGRKWLFVAYAVGELGVPVGGDVRRHLVPVRLPRAEAEDPQPDAGGRVAGVDVRLAGVQGRQKHPPTGAVAGHESRDACTSPCRRGGVLLAVFFLPLPVSRVRDTGLVALDPGHAEAVLLPEPARLTSLDVLAGQAVRKGEVLARFTSEELKVERDRASASGRPRADGRVSKSTVADPSLDTDQAQKYRRQQTEAEAEAATYSTRRAVRRPAGPAPGDPRPPRRVRDDGAADRRGRQAVRPRVLGVAAVLHGRRPDPAGRQGAGQPAGLPGAQGGPAGMLKGRRAASGLRPLPRPERPGVPRRGPVPARAERPDGAAAADPAGRRAAGGEAVGGSERAGPAGAGVPGRRGDGRPGRGDEAGGFAIVKIHRKWRSAAWWVGRTIANALDIGLY